MYPPVIPGKPVFYPPFLNPSDVLLNRFGKSTTSAKTPPFDASDPSLISSYFKAKKDEFMSKLFEKLANTTQTTSDISARSVSVESSDTTTTKPVIDSSFFLKKKYAFLETLFKTLNTTASPQVTNASDSVDGTDTTTPKPTIVPPDFWFPLPKLAKTPKPPKPTKPPKAKKVLKDALDTILLQSLLLDLGVDPKDAALNKRATLGSPTTKKSKKVKPEEDLMESRLPTKVYPDLYSAKASDCLEKLLKILNKTTSDELGTNEKPKSTVIPTNSWKKPSETEFISKLDTFLDLLIKSLNSTGVESVKPGKFEKPKSKAGKKMKRSTFLDELLHRVTTPSPTTTTQESTIPPEDIIYDSKYELIKNFIKQCCCDGNCLEMPKESSKSERSLIYKPFAPGYWLPQYLYATKMGMYLDKLMDSINTIAASDIENESSDMVKRNVVPTKGDDSTYLSSTEAAINLIIAELSELKDDLIDAFTEGIKAQKDAAPTQKTYGPSSKSFKKPFWGPKALPTADPVAPIQKRIDILNDVFDKLTKVEKTLIFASEPEYDPKLITNLTEILDLTSPKSKFNEIKVTPNKPSENPDSPAYFLTKTKEYLQNLYANKMNEAVE